ncbi:MAG: GFA family protein [Parvularculaceae bacterium]
MPVAKAREEMRWKRGACHCGAVVFEAKLPDRAVADECNCSICHRTGFLHLIVPKARFRLLSGGEQLTTYTFNTGVAKHTFCKICGVKAFYTPRSNPDGVSVNLRCLDQEDFTEIEIRPFDGRNWEANAAKLKHLSEE